MTGFAADFAGARVRPSPNFGERRGGAVPDAIILHYTGMKSGEAAEDWLCDPQSQVSSHYLVHEEGGIVQIVREADRAWHAGAGSWQGRDDVNSFSVGIEIVNPGHEFGYRDFPVIQIDAVITLCRDISARHAIAPERVLAHSDVAPGRKVDPGEKFPWRRLAEAGLGHRPPVVLAGEGGAGAAERGADIAELQALLGKLGYGIAQTEVHDPRTKAVIEAFQRHFRQRLVDGCADAETIAILRALVAEHAGA